MHNWTVTGTQLGTCTGLGGELLMWLAVASRSSPRTHNHRHSLKYNSLCNIHHLLSVMIQVSETSCYSHSTIIICTEIVYWPELDSGTLTQICFAKSTRRKPERHSCFCFWIVHLWDAWTGSQRGWRVCLEICYHGSQSTDSQMATRSMTILTRTPIQALQSMDTLAVLSPKGGCCPCSSIIFFILSNLRLFGSSVLFTHQSWCSPLSWWDCQC